MSSMLRFLAARLAQAIPTLLAVATLTFFMVRLAPGGPFSGERNAPRAVIEAMERHYGLDKPLWRQYIDFLANLCAGDFGPSFKYPSRTVGEIIADAFPVSLELGAWAMAFALLAGLSAGVTAATRPNSARDHLPMALAMAGICVPAFVLGPLLAWCFSLKLGWFDVSGWDSPSDRILPALTLGAAYAAGIARLARAGMLEVLSKDFIRTARAKGVPETLVVLRHALRGGLLPVVSYLGPAVAGVATGSFVVETIFQVPGLGRVFVTAAFNRDYTVIMGVVLFYAAAIVALNLAADLALAWLDPKIRLE